MQDQSNRPITLTSTAAAHIKSEITKDNNDPSNQIVGLRLAVKKTGCSGYAYVLDFVKAADVVSEQDYRFESHDIQIYVDSESYDFVAGTQIDYVKKHITSVIVFNNPNVAAECGCGESFTVDKNKNM